MFEGIACGRSSMDDEDSAREAFFVDFLFVFLLLTVAFCLVLFLQWFFVWIRRWVVLVGF